MGDDKGNFFSPTLEKVSIHERRARFEKGDSQQGHPLMHTSSSYKLHVTIPPTTTTPEEALPALPPPPPPILEKTPPPPPILEKRHDEEHDEQDQRGPVLQSSATFDLSDVSEEDAQQLKDIVNADIEQEKRVRILEDDLVASNRARLQQQKEIEQQRKEIAKQQKEIEHQHKGIEQQKKEVEQQKKEIEQQQREIELQQREIIQQQREMETQHKEIENLRTELQHAKKHIKHSDESIMSLHQQVELLKTKLTKLENESRQNQEKPRPIPTRSTSTDSLHINDLHIDTPPITKNKPPLAKSNSTSNIYHDPTAFFHSSTSTPPKSIHNDSVSPMTSARRVSSAQHSKKTLEDLQELLTDMTKTVESQQANIGILLSNISMTLSTNREPAMTPEEIIHFKHEKKSLETEHTRLSGVIADLKEQKRRCDVKLNRARQKLKPDPTQTQSPSPDLGIHDLRNYSPAHGPGQHPIATEHTTNGNISPYFLYNSLSNPTKEKVELPPPPDRYSPSLHRLTSDHIQKFNPQFVPDAHKLKSSLKNIQPTKSPTKEDGHSNTTQQTKSGKPEVIPPPSFEWNYYFSTRS